MSSQKYINARKYFYTLHTQLIKKLNTANTILSVYLDEDLNGEGTITLTMLNTHNTILFFKLTLMSEYITKLESLLNEMAKNEGNLEMDLLMVELEQVENDLQKCHMDYDKWLREIQESMITVKTGT